MRYNRGNSQPFMVSLLKSIIAAIIIIWVVMNIQEVAQAIWGWLDILLRLASEQLRKF